MLCGHHLIAFSPILILLVGILGFILQSLFRNLELRKPFEKTSLFATLTLACAGGSALWLSTYPELLSHLPLIRLTPLICQMQALILFLSIFVLNIGRLSYEEKSLPLIEYPLLILFAVLGSTIALASKDMLTLFLGIELLSLPLYILVALNPKNPKAAETGMKYFILGALATGFFLFGTSLIFGLTQTISLHGIAHRLPSLATSEHFFFACLGMTLIFCSLAFKLSLAPFHMWAPDVYESASPPVVAFLATISKITVFCILYVIFKNTFERLIIPSQNILLAASLLSMVIGPLGALMQNNIMRLLAYSSIGHMGYLLATFIVGGSIQSLLIYLTAYSLMIFGIFSCLSLIRKSEKNPFPSELSNLVSLSQRSGWIAAALATLMFSMAGIPPLLGFFTKFKIFHEMVNNNFLGIALFGLLSAVVAASYYLRIIKKIYFEHAEEIKDSDKISLSLPQKGILVFYLASVIAGVFFIP